MKALKMGQNMINNRVQRFILCTLYFLLLLVFGTAAVSIGVSVSKDVTCDIDDSTAVLTFAFPSYFVAMSSTRS